MRDRPQAVARILSAYRRSVPHASRAAIPAAAFLAVTALVLVSSAGPRSDLARANGGASPGAGRIAAGTSPLPSPMTTVSASPDSWLGPTETSPVGGATPTSSCVPGYGAGCVPVGPPTPLPSVNADASPRFILHVPIFEYHRVKPLTGEAGYVAGLVTVPEIFDAQMKAMALAGWHTITMGELGDYLRQSIQPAPKAFVVTFDDGYEDGYTWAYPILRRYGFVGTYFVVGSQIDKPDHMSIAEMQTLLAAGCEIGNHTISHVDLRAKTPEQLTSEIYANSALIARDVGVWPQSFAYPIGLTNANVLAALAATPGLETAVIQEGRGRETWANRWQLPRMRVGSGTYPQDLVDKATEYLQ